MRLKYWLCLAICFLPIFAGGVFGAQVCTKTYQCTEGYCISNFCTVPQIADYSIGAQCARTADCPDGFCYQNQCIIPKGQNLVYPYETKSGCSGLVQLLPFGLGGIFCQYIWAFAVAAALLAAYLSRRLPIKFAREIAFVFPLAIGLLVDPVIGFLVAIVEIAYSATVGSSAPKKPKKPKRQQELEAPLQENLKWDDEE